MTLFIKNIAFSQEQRLQSLNAPSQRSVFENDETRQNIKNNFNVNFSFQSLNYSSPFDVENSTNNAFQENNFGLNFKYINDDLGQLKINGLFQTDLNRSQNTTFAVPEAYQTYQFQKLFDYKQVLYVGRSVHFTHDADQRFNLGLVHPHFTQDHIHYESQGLTGFEYVLESSKGQIYFGGYPFYLPNQDPGVKVENGQIVAQNRWASQAPKYFLFNETQKNIVYEIKNYNISDIVMNPSYRVGAVLNANSIWDKLESISLGYKRSPMNNIVLSRETYADLQLQGQVKLAPVINYTQQSYADVTLNVNKYKLIYSYLNDLPDELSAQKNQSIQSMSQLNIQSFTFEAPHYLLNELPQKTYISYAMIDGGEVRDLNSDGSENIITVAKNRQKFFKPFKIGSVNNFYLNLKNPIQTKIEYTFDSQQKGAILSFESRYSINQPTLINFGFDILGSSYSALGQDDSADYFLVKNQAYDRFFAGVNYVY